MKRSRKVRGETRASALPPMHGVDVSGLSRKKRRKLERSEKKVRRHAFHMKNKGIIQKEMERICHKLNITQKPSEEKTVVKDRHTKQTQQEEPALKKPTKREREAVRKKNFLEDNKQEDKVIKQMEKKLFLSKRKNKNMPKSFIDEGLDYLLEVVDKKYQNSHQDSDDDDANVYVNPAKRKRKLEESKSLSAGKKQRTNSGSSISDSEGSENEFSDDDDDEPSNAAPIAKSLSRSKHRNSEDSDESSDDDSVDEENSDGHGSEDVEDEEFDEDDVSDEEGSGYSGVENNSDDELSSQDQSSSADRNASSAISSPQRRRGKGDTLNENLKLTSAKVKESKLAGHTKDVKMADTTKRSKAIDERKGSKNTLEEEDTDEISFDDESGNSGEEEDEPVASGTLSDRQALTTAKQGTASSDGMWEDIYGRLRDKAGNVVSQKYVPPAKRLQGISLSSEKKEELARLKKQVKGLLNRLSEATVQPIGMEMENLYKKHSNNDVNSTLNVCLSESIIAPFLTPERLVMEHAMLVAYMHCNVGTEVGAQILQDMTEKFNELYEQQQGCSTGKEVDNCALFISYLFVFKVVHSRIIYDIIRKLAETFSEKDVEIILLILRSVGFALRKHDPLALKEVVLLLQRKCAQDTAGAQDSRKRFMMDILNAVRNNNIQKIPNCDPSMVEHASKVLRGLFRKGCLLQELNISLEDLLKAHERGKWWVVGSAWTGNEVSSDRKANMSSVQPEFSSKILKLAQKHHMNTDVRRNIFCILMTAEDYLSASERILHLNLTATQEREMCHVVLHCLLKEKQHNPFYAYLAQFFIKRDRRFYMSLQCAVWDKFRELDRLSPTALSNLAEFLVILLSQEALSLAVLKTIQFVDMSPALLKLLRQLFSSLLLNRPQDVYQRVFLKVADAPKLRLLREGLCLFLRHFFLKDPGMDSTMRSMLKQHAELAEETLSRTDKKAIL
ncbi:nucleolar MIF4G domain-containing protein 1 isoform X1 [Dermacentor albipictus]|uniref:nucleolar MIF4G domain-containing protein 1 isoform X1 n=2 Tax=Dermacentor albipictus TaxID=60249 RepID=UPI0031FC3131